jgi:hypothetical protein
MWNAIRIGLGLMVLAACSGVTNQNNQTNTPLSNATQALGTVELELGASTPGLQAQALLSTISTTTFAGLTLTNVTSGGYPKKVNYTCGTASCRIITNKYLVKNNRSTALENLTFVALNRPSATLPTLPTLGGTNLYNIKNQAGGLITDPLVARSMRPAHGFKAASAPTIERQEADMQFVSAIPGQSNALGYGFLVHGPFDTNAASYARANSRTINPGETGTVFITYRFELPSTVTKQAWTYTINVLATVGDPDALSESIEDRTVPFSTVASFSPGIFTDGVFARMRYTCGSPLNSTNDYGLGDDMGSVTTAAISGALGPLFYTSCF